ncbi:hypothetical protein FBU30_000979 [Linnemannia zychae]|nr:hypothetical protein FBU30_000979 [Linnemannia zychae]
MNTQPATLHPLEQLPILECIGVVLDNDSEVSSLKACSLVCREWHHAFAPFLWWRVLDDFDKALTRLYKSKYAPTFTVGPDDLLETEFIALVDKFSQKAKDPLFPSAIHRQKRSYLITKSLLSFVILSCLCKPLRAIKFKFEPPPRFGYYDLAKDCLVSYRNCQMSNDYWKIQRVDNVIDVLEENPLLESLHLDDSFGVCYHWRQLELPATMVIDNFFKRLKLTTQENPRWHRLRSVTIEQATIDRHFLEILLYNSPCLRKLHLKDLKIVPIQGNRAHRNVFPDPTTYKDTHRQCLLEKLHDPSDDNTGLEELSMSRLYFVSPEQQLDFALSLPTLKTFLFRLNPELHRIRLSYRHGFHNLTTMILSGDFNHEVLIRAATHLKYLKLTGSYIVDNQLFETICRHSDTLETFIMQTASSNPNNSDGLHKVLSTCYQLQEFYAFSPKLLCSPDIFHKNSWACTKLHTLLVIPDCTCPRSTPSQALRAFFSQLAALPELKMLSFGGGTGINDFFPHQELDLLTPLRELEVLNISSCSLETNAPLTIEHADLIVNEWPRLEAVEGLYHYECRPFLKHVQEHRPEIDFSQVFCSWDKKLPFE